MCQIKKMCEKSILLAGAARELVTPKVGTCLVGYRPNSVSTSIHDPLSVTALALCQGGKKVLMVSMENCEIAPKLNMEMREGLSTLCQIPWEHILLSATHTHSGPNLFGVSGWGEADMEYYEQIFWPAMQRAARKACDALRPAELAVGEVLSDVGVNRREQKEDGSIALGQNPYASRDPYMTLIAIRDAENKEGILNMIHYGCHGTSAGDNSEITRDWSGIMIDRVEQETGTLTAFWNGAIGDVGPRLSNGKTVGNIHYTEELGGVAAADAMRAYKARGGYHSENLEIFKGTIKIPNKELPELSAIEEKLRSYEKPEELINLKRLEYQYYKMVYEYMTSPNPVYQESFSFEQTLVALGDVLFIPFPFEMFSEIVMRLRNYAPYRYTLSLSNTHGSHCYLPTESELCRGGYEIGCFRYIRVFQLVDNADQHIINENLRILRDENAKIVD